MSYQSCLTVCKREPVLWANLLIGILDTHNFDDIELFKESFQEIYDGKIADAIHIKEMIETNSSQYKLVITSLFMWSILADRLDHFLETFLPIRQDRVRTNFYEINQVLVSNISRFRKLKDRFTQKFLDYQFDMSTGDINLFLFNKEINSLSDLYTKIFCNKRFSKGDHLTFTSFINNRMNSTFFRELYLTSACVKLINDLYTDINCIDIEIINKLKIANIEDLLNLTDKYLIFDISLSSSTASLFTTDTLNLYLKRVPKRTNGPTYHGFNLHKIIDFVSPDVLTEELVKKYYSQFFYHARSNFIEKVLMPRYALKDLIKILEGCA